MSEYYGGGGLFTVYSCSITRVLFLRTAGAGRGGMGGLVQYRYGKREDPRTR